MEAKTQQKPRLTYAQFIATQQPDSPLLVRSIIARFIAEMNGTAEKPGVKPLGLSHLYTLRMLQASPLGAELATELTKGDIIAHCRQRQAEKIKPQTVMHAFTYLSGAMKYAGSAWDGCEEVSDAACVAAQPFLIKHNLICKSAPRTRRPTPEEHARLLEHFAQENLRPKNKIDMVKVADWQYKSCRRISESCRMQWTDWERDTQTLVVHKMKDPRNRNKTKRVALTDEAQALLVKWWETRDPNEPRILPYISASCSARYTMAKHACGIEGLRMHDSRRDRFTRLVEDDGYSLEEAIMFTGHETVAVPQKNYLAMKPELMRFGPKATRKDVTVAQLNAAGHLFVTPEGVGTSKAA